MTPRIKPLIPASSPSTSLDLEKLKQLRILAGVEVEDEGQKREKSEQNPGLLSYKNIGGDGFLLTDGLATEIVQMESGDQVSLTKSYFKVPHIRIGPNKRGGKGTFFIYDVDEKIGGAFFSIYICEKMWR